MITNKKYANRGMELEEDINLTNKYYLENNIAIIYKKPTPIRVTKMNYETGKITEAFFENKSTLDYNGIYKGKYIEFDAKETNLKTRFPLSNIPEHQYNHLKNIIKHNGICFLIIKFVLLNKIFLIMGKDIIMFIEDGKTKSIPINYFINNCEEIELKYSPRLDYISKLNKKEVDKDENK